MRLLKKSKEEIKNRYPELYSKTSLSLPKRILQDFRASDFKTILSSYLLISILILLYSEFLNFKFLQLIQIDYKNIIGTLTTSIITLVSINLLATNFLFTFLKDEIDNLQSIIEKRVHYRFSTFLGFSIIISVLILFFIGDIGSDITKTNILIFIFCTFVLYIFIIVNLYATVFDFLNKNKRDDLIKKEIFKEFYSSFYAFKLKQVFYNNYKSFYNQLGIKEESSPFFPTVEHSHYAVIKSKKDLYLRDVRLNVLCQELKNYPTDKTNFYPLNLDQQFINANDSKIISSEETLNEEKIKSAFILSQKRCLQEPNFGEITKLEKNIENSIDKNEIEVLEQNLNILEGIYKSYLDIEYGN